MASATTPHHVNYFLRIIEMPIALFALTLSAFAIGTTEFVIVGLVPTIATDLGVTLPSAGQYDQPPRLSLH